MIKEGYYIKQKEKLVEKFNKTLKKFKLIFATSKIFWLEIAAGTGYEEMRPGVNKRMEEYNMIIRRNYGDDFVPIQEIMMEVDGFNIDNMHWNKRGHKVVEPGCGGGVVAAGSIDCAGATAGHGQGDLHPADDGTGIDRADGEQGFGQRQVAGLQSQGYLRVVNVDGDLMLIGLVEPASLIVVQVPYLIIRHGSAINGKLVQAAGEIPAYLNGIVRSTK